MNMNHLSKTDSQIEKIIKQETSRQKNGLGLIASENLVSEAVLETLGTSLTNKYSEGYPGKRYYGGNEFIDQAETLAIERAKKLFRAEHANVQPHSGSQANMATYFAFLEPHDKVMAMSLAFGGHLTHGHKVNFSGQFYNFVHYGVDKNGFLDYDEIRELARKEKPKMIVAGFTAYPRKIDFKKFREIADEVNAYLMVDMAHIAGLIAGGAHPDPVPYADVVTSTTHKTLRGPRGALILCKEKYAKKIDKAVMPGIQGGPLEHVIAAKAVAFKEALKPKFKKYATRVVKNAQTLAETLTKEDIEIVSGGTDTHLLLLDLTNIGITGSEAENMLEEVKIYTNKNLIPFDKRKPMNPSGLRLGTPTLTTRGFDENDMKKVGKLIANILKKKITKEDAQKIVKELTKKYPIYENN
ncbi:MAG: serine hydroxymethyltransferase [Patescibacteria group bacterium]|nr:serine hydroxymethyltransferase [Patescibacteria group bacterium]